MSSVFVSPTNVASRGLSFAGGVVLALALPVVAVRVWSVSCADRLGSSLASGMTCVVSPAQVRAAETAPLAPIDDDIAPSSAPPDTFSAVSARDAKHAHTARRSQAPLVLHGIRISAAQVLALAERRAMPQAVPVKESALHPAGLLLHGVSGLGVGMQDGDVLTEAAGQKASSVATVVGVVIAARGRQAPEISGRFFRAGVPYSLTVEQPYPKRPVPG